MISDAALDKIISAVDARQTLDQSKREKLRREIEDAKACYDDAVVFKDKGRAKALEKRLTAFRKAVKSLDTQLADQTFYDLIEGTLILHGLQRPLDLRALVNHLLKAADLVRKPPPGAICTPSPPGLLEVSPRERLAGRQLPETYERIFGRKSGRSRAKAGQPTGPCFRFIEAVFRELQIDYQPESIVRAITERRAPPTRAVRLRRRKK